jgi:hypothetical protein
MQNIEMYVRYFLSIFFDILKMRLKLILKKSKSIYSYIQKLLVLDIMASFASDYSEVVSILVTMCQCASHAALMHHVLPVAYLLVSSSKAPTPHHHVPLE